MLPIIVLVGIVVALGALLYQLRSPEKRAKEVKYTKELAKFLGLVMLIVMTLMLVLRGIRYL